MKRLLHLLSYPNDPLPRRVIAVQSEDKELQVTVVDLSNPNLDYSRLLDQIFSADSIQSW
jgi:hypothetical protein